MADPVKYFDRLGTCGCGHPATGTLRGPNNESYGVACERCGERRVERAAAERQDLNKRWAGLIRRDNGEKR